MTEWKETKMAENPDPVKKIGPGLYLQSRKIRYVSPEEGYICETREVTESELILVGEEFEILKNENAALKKQIETTQTAVDFLLGV